MESKCLYYSLDCQGTVIDVFAYTSDIYFARPGMMMNEEINYNHRSILVRQAAFCIICEQFPWLTHCFWLNYDPFFTQPT